MRGEGSVFNTEVESANCKNRPGFSVSHSNTNTHILPLT